MIKLRRILFPTDFSDNANAARQYACSLAEQYGAELHVVHVLTDPGFLMPQPACDAIPGATSQALEQAADQELARAIDAEWAKQLKIVRSIRIGPPFLEILQYAQKHEIDLIVMSTHGRTGLMHLLLGSVAENVVRKSKCPVLTIHPADHSFVMP